MNDLLLAQCDPKAPLMDADTRSRVLAQLPGWLPDADAKLIGRRFGFANFYQTMAFV
ncbi:MAG: 4a-hydroxytetrahydrobiopterin dehydratase, partial [Rubrivivax sp.]